MFLGICEAIVVPFFAEHKVHEGWEVGEVRYGLYKCLSVQVRGSKAW